MKRLPATMLGCALLLGAGTLPSRVGQADPPRDAAPASAGDALERAAADPGATGLLITAVMEGSPGDTAGLREGDILVSYAGTPVRSQEDFVKIAQAKATEPKLEIRCVRDGEEKPRTVSGGRLGIVVLAVEKGKAVPRPPETRFEPNLAALTPGERFYNFRIDGKKVGFERHALEIAGDALTLDRLARFKSGDLDANQRIRMRLTRERYLPVQMLEFTAGGEPPLHVDRKGARLQGKDGSDPVDLALPPRTVPSAVADLLALTMPRETGACLHFTMLNEGVMKPVSCFDLLCAGQESVETGGKQVEAFRYEARRLGVVTNRWWITGDHRLVKCDYHGPTSELTTRDDALQGLPPGVDTKL